MKIVKYLIATALCFVSMSYGQRQTVMTDTNGNVVFPTNFWNQAPVSTNTQEFIGTNAFGETNGFLQFVTRKHDATYPQQNVWTAMPDAYAGVTPQGRLWLANADPLINSNISLAVFSNVADLSQQTNLTITNANAAQGGYRYNAERNVMYASGRNDRVIGINPTNYSVSVVSTNAGAQHRPALIVGEFMYVSKGGAPEGLAKIDLTTDTQLTNIAVAPTNASTSAIYRMETNPAGTILAGSMTGISSGNSVFFTIDLATFTPTITSTSNVIFEVVAANDTHAFVSGNPSGAFNLANHNFIPMGGISYSGILSTNGNVYFFGNGEIYEYNLDNANLTTYYTGKFGTTDRLYGMAEIDGKIIAIDGSTNIYELVFSPSIASQNLSVSNVVGSQEVLTVYTNVLTSNITPPTGRAIWLDYVADGTNRAINATLQFSGSGNIVGDVFIVRNRGTSNNLLVQRTGVNVAEGVILPNQQRGWVYTGTGIGEARWKLIQGLSPLGLSGGISTNRTFISYNGTNYTTNTVTISNGIITGWTQ